MSLTGALSNSVSGLMVSQASIALVSQNVANANNTEYTRRTAVQEAVVVDGFGSGVRIAEIKRFVDEFLLRDVRESVSEFGRYEVQTPYLDRLQAIFGQPNSDTNLSARLDKVYAAFETAGTLPDNTAARSQVVFAIDSLVREVQQIADEIQLLRTDIELQLQTEVSEINDALGRIADLNVKISEAIATDGSLGDFMDQRDTQLKIIAKRMSVTTYTQGDGRVVVMGGNGTLLLDTTPRVLEYRPASTAEPGAVFDDIRVRSSTAPSGTGVPMEKDILSGRIRGLLDLRDVGLHDTASMIGEFSARLADEINRIHNDNAAFPPPNSLTGSQNTGLLATDPHNFTGKVTFSVIDPNGPSANAYGVVASVTMDFDAGTVDRDFAGAPVPVALNTIQDIIWEISAANGLAGAGTLSFTGGVMSLTATDPAHGIAIAQDATTPSSRGGRGFSHFFGLNDLLTASVPTFYDNGFAGADTHQFTGGTDFTILDANGELVITAGFTPVAGDFNSLVTQLNTALTIGGTAYATFAIDATTGRVTMTEASNITILAHDQGPPTTSDRGGTGIGLASLLGFGEDKTQQVARTLAVNPSIANNIGLVALANLQGSALNDPGVTPGDNRGARALAALVNTSIITNAAGNIAGRVTNLGNYAGLVLSESANYAAQTSGREDESRILFDTLERKAQEISGVNVDEEMSNLIILQNAFAASARVVSVVDSMFEELLNISF